MKKAPLGCIALALAAGLAGWYISATLVKERIEILATANAEKKDRIERLEKENEQLRKGVAENGAPLKHRSKLLSDQLFQFARSGAAEEDMRTDYFLRFKPRIDAIVLQMDERGIHSDKVQEVFRGAFSQETPRVIAEQILMMSEKLKE